jgi:oligopeptidase B
MIINPPIAKKIAKQFENHGIIRQDNYYWLNDRENPEVIQYLEDENAYTKSILAPLESLQQELYNEITSRIKAQDQNVPYFSNGYWYIIRYEEGMEHPIYERKKISLEAGSELLLNVNELAKEHKYYQISVVKISPNNKILCFGEDTTGRRQFKLRFYDLETKTFYEDEIKNTDGNAVWANDNLTIFYTIKNKSLREYKIMKHILGMEEEQEVYHEKDETFYVHVSKSRSKEYIIISSTSTLTSEHRYIDANLVSSDFILFAKRERGIEYDIDHNGKKWIIRTNKDAKNFQLMQCSNDKTDSSAWVSLIPYEEHIFIEDFDCFSKFIVITERVEGLTKIKLLNDDHTSHYINFQNEAVYQVSLGINPEHECSQLRLHFSSLKTQNCVLDYTISTKVLEIKKITEIVGGHNPDEYTTQRIFATTIDDVKIPISLIYKTDLRVDNTPQALLLYGYGSYGISIDPSFSLARKSLLDRGFIYAIAHIRGGEEMGRQWYEDGKLLNKQNTFSDFICCAEHLIQIKYSNPNLLCAMGGSAGGLLMGAVVNQRPELWKAVIAAVPFVDVVTTMLDESIPLTTGEYDEWGNPNDPQYFEAMLKYSPLDHVSSQMYPNMLVTTGLHDSQVQYWEPAKWVAKLRELKTDQNRLLMHCNMDTGHSGDSGRFKVYKEIAMNYAFLIGILQNKI